MAAVVPDNFPDLCLSGHSFIEEENSGVFIGGYESELGKKGDSGNQKLIKLTVRGNSVQSFYVTDLGCGPMAQGCLMSTPTCEVYIMGGGIQERWSLISKTQSPSAPCDLALFNQCILVRNPD